MQRTRLKTKKLGATPISHHRQHLGDPASGHRHFSLSTSLETRGHCRNVQYRPPWESRSICPFPHQNGSMSCLLISITDFQFRTSNASIWMGKPGHTPASLLKENPGRQVYSFYLGRIYRWERKFKDAEQSNVESDAEFRSTSNENTSRNYQAAVIFVNPRIIFLQNIKHVGIFMLPYTYKSILLYKYIYI